jgi:hypothetical protein
MTDEKFILKFLNKNYVVVLDDIDVKVKEKDTTKTFSFDYFIAHRFNLIVGNYLIDLDKTSKDVVVEWFKDKKIELVKDLFDYLSNMDTKFGAIQTLTTTLKKFKRKKQYSEKFVIGYFHSYYNDSVIKPRLLEYIGKYENGLNCKEFSENFDNQLSLDTPKQQEFARDFLYDWYCKTIIGEKVNEFFSQLVITMGPRNWVVTWIGHGQLTKEKMYRYFPNEPEIILRFISESYDKWYEEAVITASKRYINSNSGFLVA